jgi:hypothetical protein
MDGRFHRCPGRETIVHDNHGATVYKRMLAVPAEQPISTVELKLFADGNVLNEGRWNAKLCDKCLVYHLDTTRGDGSHCEFRVTRDAELANQEDVERQTEASGDLGRNRHAAARQRQDDNVRAAGV